MLSDTCAVDTAGNASNARATRTERIKGFSDIFSTPNNRQSIRRLYSVHLVPLMGD